ncbi:MAG: chromate efflux transporter [Hyphomicrobiaceae bacterium]|nr:chromate efflux transporter [Hyphomicrobiaceae bacterium]
MSNPSHSRSSPSWIELWKAFGAIGLLSFGGPAGQIALMHRVIVEERGWLDEARFLRALNYCMLLPGPEAMQLAAYAGWLLRGVAGGLLAGLLFILPGFFVLIAFSALYVTLGEVPLVAGLFFGIKAAVLAIVAEALVKVARRALKQPAAHAVAFLSFVAIFVFAVPFPLIILMAALAGAIFFRQDSARAGMPVETIGHAHVLPTLLLWGGLWALPVAGLVLALGPESLFAREATFFSWTAIITFGGAYAVLAYVAQVVVSTYHWLSAADMLAGLGLAETTPGPLILVLVFVGFVAAHNAPGGLDPMLAGVLGAGVTLWVTFVPCFLWIFLGAPYVEGLGARPRLSAALSGVTAAVVGVIANLALWFAVHVLFAEVGEGSGLIAVPLPLPQSLDVPALAIAALSFVLVFALRAPVLAVIGAGAVLGAFAKLSGLA